MTMLKLSTARTILVGPVLDSDGVAKTDEAVASIKITKNGTVGAADGSATLTHDHVGMYKLALTANDTDALGVLEISLNSGTNAMPMKTINVVPANVFDSLIAGSATLGTDAIAISGDTTAADNLELDYDGTGYAKANSTIGTCTTLTNLPAITANWLTATGINAGAITSDKFAADAITSTVMASSSIGASQLAANAINSTSFQAGAITAAAIATDAITTIKIADGCLTAAKFAASSLNGKGDWNTTTPPTVTQITADMDANSTKLSDIVADTNELQTDDVPGLIAALNNLSAADVNAECDSAIVDAALATSAEMALAQSDLDILTGSNGVTLATAQANYAPATVAALASLVTTIGTPADTDIATDIAALPTASEINAEVAAVINTDTSAEPGQGAPPPTASLRTKLDWLYKAWRNRSTQSATEYKLYNSAGIIVDSKATVSDDDVTYDREDVVTGP